MRTLLHKLLPFLAAFVASFASAQPDTPTMTYSGPATAVPSQSVGVMVHLASASPFGRPTGSVSFTVRDVATGGNFTPCAGVSLDLNADAACSFTAPSPGNYSVDVTYGGDTYNSSLSQSFGLTTAQVTPTMTYSGMPASPVSGQGIGVLVHLASTSPVGRPTGTVSFTVRNVDTGGSFTPCASATLDLNADASCGFTAPAPGNYSVDVTYGGDTANASLSQGFPFTTAQVTPAFTLSGLPASALPSQSIGVTVHLDSTSPVGRPTGAVSFTVREVASGASFTPCSGVTLDLNADAACSFTAPGSVGNYSLDVQYAGDTSNAATTSGFRFAVASPTPTITAIRPSSGAVAGGGAVEIDGSNLDVVGTVTIGGASATILRQSATALTVAAPAHSAGAGDVFLLSYDASSSATATNGFTFVNDDNVARDFSLASNPSPRWTYGSENARGGAFTLYAARSAQPSGMDFWWNGSEPLVAHNPTSGTIAPAGANPIPSGGLAMHPGSGGENSVVRWTAPAAGTYHVAGAFTGLDTFGTTTDVAVLHNNNAATALFTATVAEYGLPHAFGFDVVVAAGDTIEFTVGFGGNGYGSDTTGLDATISFVTAAAPTPAPITYVFNLLLSGTLNGVPFTNATSTITATGDANLVGGTGVVCSGSLSSVVFSIIGAGSGTITDTMALFDNQSVSALGFQRGCNSADWLNMTDPAFATYDLRSNLGPMSITNAFSPGGQESVNTTLGVLSLASATTFTGTITTRGGTPAPAVTFSPASLTFPSQTVGTTSAPQSILITNTGTASLSISSITASGDFTVSGSCAPTMVPGDGCTLTVSFTPSATGTRAGNLTVLSNAGTSVAPLSGNGVAPSVPVASLTPSSLAFASRTVSTTSLAQTVTIANTGSAMLNISSIAINGDFAFTSACASTLAPGASCTVDVTFTPLVAGARTGSLTITDNASGSPHIVALNGTGLAATAAVLDVSPRSLDFAVEPVNHDSAPELVTVTNTGTATLSFSAISVTGDFRQVGLPAGNTAAPCPVDLAPRSSCQLAIVFHPTAPNLRGGQLTIQSNAGSVNVTLAGTGLAPAVPQLSMAAALTFGPQPVGTRSAGKPIAITNTSASIATLTELSANGDFSVSDTCATIAPGATCSPLVFFQPTNVGTRVGTLMVRTLRDADPYLVDLDGVGVENRRAVLELSATHVGFGDALVGSASTVTITLKNVGQAAAIIESITATSAFFTSHSCTTIEPGATCSVHLTFLPGSNGHYLGAMEVRSNAVGSPQAIEVSGTGCFVPSPSRARFGVLLCGN